ncbi:MAG: anti-sigma F factor [Ruminococcaceae bacterium]|nr:anti-sigma F factor [Oscillospiraceae bacterium]
MINELRITFPSLSANESFARAAAAAFIAQLNPTYEEVADIKCAVSEAVTNAIVHGYRDTMGDIFMNIKLTADRTVRIEIRDRGCGIPDVTEAMKPLFTTDPENERSGMGFTVMENFMDKMKVISTVGKGTKVTMTKRLSPVSRMKG